jgi:adenine-specific DNA-methyltransferase
MATKLNSELKQHFTDAKPINEVMCHLLGSVEGRSGLEPSVGHGAFLHGLMGRPARIDVVDVDDGALSIVQSQFQHLNPNVFHTDFVDLFVGGLMTSDHPIRRTSYDFVISNPPYGLYFDLQYRKQIRRAFPDSYARESYGLFFTFAVSQLRQRGRYVFLIPDTFLSSVNHRPLRLFMCAHAAPTHVIRFPSKFFETVNFGYGNLCIVAGEKRALSEGDTLRWLEVFEKGESLSVDGLRDSKPFSGSVLLDNAELGWSSAMFYSPTVAKSTWTSLGEIAECRTGIYTGDNERFIGYDARRITRRLNGHSIEWGKKVFEFPLSREQRAGGLDGDRNYVPLIRGGHREPFERTAWAIFWTKEAIAFYRTDKKARLQNAQFYFRDGLSVPMVTTKRISASLMSNAIFDQGVVGVFPRKPAETPALLLYLNSGIASEKMKTLVNGSANNSANYLKRLPVPLFSDVDLGRAALLVADAQRYAELSSVICDDFVMKCMERTTDECYQLR